MAKVKIQGHASGTGVLTVTAPNTSTDRTITLPDATGTLLNSDGDGSSLTGVGVAGITSSADATAITIDSNEQVTMGGTTLYAGQGNTATGQHFENTGTGYLSRTGGYALGLNRNTSDGTIINFARQGSSVGSIDASTSGISIKLGGTATANTLDDYEEGTWTPQMDSDYSSVSYHGDNQGTYTKIGNVVIVNFRLHVNSWSGSSSGYATVCNLPFTVVGDATFTAANPSWHFSLAEFPGTGYCNSNTTEIVWMRNHTGGDRIHLTGDDVFGSSGDARICGSATYITTQ